VWGRAVHRTCTIFIKALQSETLDQKTHRIRYQVLLQYTQCFLLHVPLKVTRLECTRWFKHDRDDLCVNKSQFVPVIFEPPCTIAFLNPSTSEGNLTTLKKSRSYRAVNTLRLGCKIEPVNVVFGNNRCLFSDAYGVGKM
jgi:hypothetical protein